MAIWSSEIKELEKLSESLKGQLPDLEKELGRLIKADDENMILLYSRRCLEVIITDLCECELKRPRKTEPLKGIIDKLHKEGKVPSNIITSMDHLNSLSAYGAHPKDFDPEQVKPVLVNLDIIIKWYLKYKNKNTISINKAEEFRAEAFISDDITGKFETSNIKLILLISGVSLVVIVVLALFVFNIIGGGNQIKVLERSIAVLPFSSISANKDDTFLSDGITETIISHLSKMNELRVISRTSVDQFNNSTKTSQEITSELGVIYLLRGSVQTFKEKLRISVQLVNGKEGFNLWAENYDEDYKDIFVVQSQIAQKIADALKIHISSDEHKRITNIPTKNLNAYDQYVKGRFYWNKRTEDDLLKATEYFKNAIDLDARFAQAWSGLADSYTMLVAYNYMSSSEGKLMAKEAAFEAIRLNPGLAEPQAALGFIYAFLEYDLKRSEDAFELAISYEPSYATAHSWHAWELAVQGKYELAEEHIELARNLDPLSNIILASAGYIAYLSGLNERAESLLLSAIEQNPEFPRFHLWLSYIYWIKEDWDSTLYYLENGVKLSNRHPQYLSALGFYYGITDQQDKAVAIQQELMDSSQKRYVSFFDIALTFLGTHDVDRALEYLNKAHEAGDMWITFLAVDQRFRYLRDNPEFVRIVRSTGLELN
jgi:TolB-like protein